MDIRRCSANDAAAVRELGSRLTTGLAPWRDETAVLAAVDGWVDAALAGQDDQRPVFVAETDGRVVGFATAGTRKHWAGDTDAYIGELAVATDHTEHGVGRALVDAVETWARQFGYARITLETGARNHAARSFYQRLGYTDEEVVLTRALK
jgi:ribosomal protein S18 acetylase RimI-like enzyme